MLSVVMCSRDDQRFAAAEANWAKAMGAEPYEIIRIPDARSMSEGYNRGYLDSHGDRLVFCHDDAFFLTGGAPEKLSRHFARFDVFGIAGSAKVVGPKLDLAGPPNNYGQVAMNNEPHGLRVVILSVPAPAVPGMKLLDGVLIGATREAVERIDGWDESYPGFHCYDVDFSFRAHLAGLRVGVACDLDILHTANSDYNNPQWRTAAIIFDRKHRQHLPPVIPIYRFQETIIHADDLDHAARLMRPPHWETIPATAAGSAVV